MGAKAAKVRVHVSEDRGKADWVKAGRVEIDFGDGRRLLINISAEQKGVELVAGSLEDDMRLDARRLADNAFAVSVDSAADESGAAPVAPVLNLAVQKALDDASRVLSPKKHRLRRWASAALQEGCADVTIRLVSESEARALNRDFRNKDYATNVLTFVYGDDALPEAAATRLVGDIVLCVPVIAREAVKQGKTLDAHFAHLVVHGMLHLQGFDHEVASEADAMEALEAEILATLGYGDPYA